MMEKRKISQDWIDFFTRPQQPIKNIDSFKDAKQLVQAVNEEVNDILKKALALDLFDGEASFFHFIHIPPVKPIKQTIDFLTLPLLVNRNIPNYDIALPLIWTISSFLRNNEISFIRPATKIVAHTEKGLLMLITDDHSNDLEKIKEDSKNFDIKIIKVGKQPIEYKKEIKNYFYEKVKNHKEQYIKEEDFQNENIFAFYNTLKNIPYDENEEVYQYIEKYKNNFKESFSNQEFIKSVWGNNIDEGYNHIASHISTFGQFSEKNTYIFSCIPKVHNIGDKIGNLGGVGSVFMFNGKHPPSIETLNQIYIIINYAASAVVKYSVGYSVLPQLEYKNSLSIFSHHVGKLFQESGLSDLHKEIQILNQPTPEPEKLKKLYGFLLHRLKKRLMLVWGIKEAFNLLKEGYQLRWFDADSKNITDSDIYDVLEDMCLFIVIGQMCNFKNKISEQTEIIRICRDDQFEDYSLADISEISDNIPFGVLPPFDGNDDFENGKKAAYGVTIGLCELIRNACNTIKRDTDKLLEYSNNNPLINFRLCNDNKEKYFIEITNLSYGKVKNNKDSSIKKIQIAEENVISIKKESGETFLVAKTDIDMENQEEIGNNIFKITAKWTFFYKNLCDLKVTLSEKEHDNGDI